MKTYHGAFGFLAKCFLEAKKEAEEPTLWSYMNWPI
jgi:hypothetical protein